MKLLVPALAALFACVPAMAQEAPDPGAVRVQIDYLGPQEHSLLAGTREIDIGAVNVSRDWRLPAGFTGSLTGGVMTAWGERRDPGQLAISSGATGLLFGGGLRFAPVRIGRVTPFVEGSVQALYSFGHPFPAGGTSVNGFVRWGGGASVHVSDRVAVEAGWHGAHVSNGGEGTERNPAWDGHGAFIGISLRPKRR